MPNYETHEVHLNQIFFKVKSPTDSPGPFNAIKQYLSRDPQFFSLKFMHDTLADVLRGKIDHPIVGDIRMLAQEMGVTGRVTIEKQALQDGWEHVKAEYEVDKAGGLEPLLAYSYFTAKNFGVENVKQLALDLANEHIESPLSQGLFAITGPMTEVPQDQTIEEVGKVATALDGAGASSVPTDSQEPSKDGIEDAIGKLVTDKLRAALGKESMKELDVSGGLKGLGTIIKAAMEKAKESPEIEKGLTDLQKLGIGDFKGLPKSVSKYIEDAISEMEDDIEKPRKTKRTSFQQLEELLTQDSVHPSRLSRTLARASLRAAVLSKQKKLKDARKIGKLLEEGAKRLVLLDSMEYIDTIEKIHEGLSVTIGDFEAAKTITEITSEIEVALLDEKSQKEICRAFDEGVKRSAKLGDFKSYRAYFSGKWNLMGIDSKDLSTVANQIEKLIGYGRTAVAFDLLSSFHELFDESQYEISIGLTKQAFKGISKVKVSNLDEIKKIVEKIQYHLDKHIQSMKTNVTLSGNEIVADLCTTAVSSTVSMMETYVKSIGKERTTEEAYSSIHEILKPLVANTVEALKIISLEKPNKSMVKIIKKLKGESESKAEMVKAVGSLIS
jgi:hypothetical protein